MTVLPVSIGGVTAGNTHTGWPVVTPDPDRFAFVPAVTQSCTITLSWSPSAIAELFVDLYDDTQTLIGIDPGWHTGISAKSITMVLQAGSTYYVRVLPNYTGWDVATATLDYTLTIAP